MARWLALLAVLLLAAPWASSPAAAEPPSNLTRKQIVDRRDQALQHRADMVHQRDLKLLDGQKKRDDAHQQRLDRERKMRDDRDAKRRQEQDARTKHLDDVREHHRLEQGQRDTNRRKALDAAAKSKGAKR